MTEPCSKGDDIKEIKADVKEIKESLNKYILNSSIDGTGMRKDIDTNRKYITGFFGTALGLLLWWVKGKL